MISTGLSAGGTPGPSNTLAPGRDGRRGYDGGSGGSGKRGGQGGCIGRGGQGYICTRKQSTKTLPINERSDLKGATEKIDGHVYQTFAKCPDRRQFNTMTAMLGKYVNKKMKFAVDLMPVYEYLSEPTMPRPAEVRDENEAFEVEVVGNRLTKRLLVAPVVEERKR